MATLEEALYGLNYTPMDTGYGIAAQQVGQLGPQLINPYGSTGQAVGIGLGTILLQSLLGYQARSQAAQDTLQLNTLANQMQTLETPQARTDFIGGVSDPLQQSRLSTLATALNAQDLQARQKLKDAVALETGKMKAMQEFYSTPEGEKSRAFQLELAAQEARARRGLTVEEELALINARGANRLNVVAATGEQARKTAGFKADLTDASREKQNAFTERMKELDRKARSGDQQSKLDFERQQQEINANLKRELLGLSVDIAVEKKRRIDELTMQNRELGQDPKLALVNAQATIAQELIDAREAASGRLIEKARQERELEAASKKALELANPKAPAALVTENVRRIGASNMAVEIADDLDRYANWVTYRIGTAFSAADEMALRSRLKKLSFEERKALSGTATTDKEKADINDMMNGDFSAGPETKAMLLRRFAADSRRLAMDNMKGGFASAGDFIKAVEQGMQSGGRIEFGTPVTQAPSTGAASATMAVQEKLNQLKAKYQVASPADLRGKLTAAEQQELATLTQAARR